MYGGESLARCPASRLFRVAGSFDFLSCSVGFQLGGFDFLAERAMFCGVRLRRQVKATHAGCLMPTEPGAPDANAPDGDNGRPSSATPRRIRERCNATTLRPVPLTAGTAYKPGKRVPLQQPADSPNSALLPPTAYDPTHTAFQNSDGAAQLRRPLSRHKTLQAGAASLHFLHQAAARVRRGSCVLVPALLVGVCPSQFIPQCRKH